MSGRRDPLLFLAAAASLALVATVRLAPDAFWRLPLAIFGGIWAPGYAIAALVWRRGALSGLERHALAATFGLLLAPLAGLLASETMRFTPTHVALIILAVTLAGALFARRADAYAPEPAARAAIPSTRATVAITIGALVLAAILVAPTFAARPEPSALALTSADGAPIVMRWDAGVPQVVRIEASAGSAAISSALVVTWDNETVLEERVVVAAGETRAIELALPADARGAHALVARWDEREVHARIQVGGA